MKDAATDGYQLSGGHPSCVRLDFSLFRFPALILKLLRVAQRQR